MTPCVLFLNGPECDSKLLLLQKFKQKFSEEVCIYINRKNILSMFNANLEEKEESFEWILQKILKNIINNGVYVIFDVFLPTRRMNQYAIQLKGLPCYWLGVFIKDKSEDFSKEFYDFSVVIDPNVFDFSDIANDLFNYVSKNDACCFCASRSVEKKPRKRLIYREKDNMNNSNDINLSSNDSKEPFNEFKGKTASVFSKTSLKNSKKNFSKTGSRFNNDKFDKGIYQDRRYRKRASYAYIKENDTGMKDNERGRISKFSKKNSLSDKYVNNVKKYRNTKRENVAINEKTFDMRIDNTNNKMDKRMGPKRYSQGFSRKKDFSKINKNINFRKKIDRISRPNKEIKKNTRE